MALGKSSNHHSANETTSQLNKHQLFLAATDSHYNDAVMGAMSSQITSLTIVCWTVYFRRRSKITSKLCITGLCEGNSPVPSEFPAQRASNVENVSIWWRHHGIWILWVLSTTFVFYIFLLMFFVGNKVTCTMNGMDRCLHETTIIDSYKQYKNQQNPVHIWWVLCVSFEM